MRGEGAHWPSPPCQVCSLRRSAPRAQTGPEECAMRDNSDQRPATIDQSERVGMMRAIRLTRVGNPDWRGGDWRGRCDIRRERWSGRGADRRGTARRRPRGKLDCSSDRATASGARPRSRRSGSCPRTRRSAGRCAAHPILVDTDTRHEMVANNYARISLRIWRGGRCIVHGVLRIRRDH